jgi:hypothetical protein
LTILAQLGFVQVVLPAVV